ncbi:MAG: glutamate-5-semialdehyde dehydrogenase [Chloroflexi bacterium]|nr:glutamate-5-semialdehyde dehydrogenase [Chloroflexota bacterium]
MTSVKTNELLQKGRAAKAAARRLAYLSTEVKDRALEGIARGLLERRDAILAANARDMAAGRAEGLSDALLDRLLLDEQRLAGMASDVRAVAALPDPVGEVFDMRTLPNGLVVGRRRVPLGVIGTVYESRPNVTVDISVLCLKSGNAVVLRGGKEARHSNGALAALVREQAAAAGVPADAVQFIESTDRAVVDQMLKLKDCIDLLVPRGGSGLIEHVRDHAAMPVVAGGIGVCHTYVDRAAKLGDAVRIVYNAKVQRPTVCNALDTILVHREVAGAFLPAAGAELAKAGVELHCDAASLTILKSASGGPGARLRPAVQEDWGKEFLALVAAVKVVDSLDEALQHIERYGSGHSEAIVTEDYSAAMRFLAEVDAAAVFVNASTRFTDGSQFGLGAEVGISTQKMHARGPLGLREMTSYKWIIMGRGHVRP